MNTATVLDHRGKPAVIHPGTEPLARVRRLLISGDLLLRALRDGFNETIPVGEKAPSDLTIVDAGFDAWNGQGWILLESESFELVNPSDPPVWTPIFARPEVRCPNCNERVR